MRVLFLFATAYALIAAVACQPLRDAASELQTRTKVFGKPPKPPNAASHATPKVKRVSKHCSYLTIVSLFG